ncbi:MAG: hypothetical protein FJ138_03805 [Deltaproteobacteria bacterium]|nr:hypothetical protein [Deltaproteobacteria bacterium]
MAGTGFGVYTGSTSRDVSYVTGGVGARFDVLMLQLEAQITYLGATVTGDHKMDASLVSLPLMARFDLSPIPLLKLTAGAGLEQRVLLKQGDAQLFADSAQYLPVSVCADLSVPVLGSVGLEARFSYMLSDPRVSEEAPKNDKTHDLMIFGHLFF